MKRIHNFGPGPGALPLPVLEQAQTELVDFRGAGMSLLEMSHRGKIYEEVHAQTIADLRALLTIPDDYAVLFMQGGARSQFAFVPMNLLGKGGHADYITTGFWSECALAEAKKLGEVREIWSSAKDGHNHVPKAGVVKCDGKAAYVHYTSNNTIYGTQWHYVPEVGSVPLVCDMSSDIASRPLEVNRFGLIYAGAQKNIGPAGVTLVIIRKDLLARSGEQLPDMFSYAQFEKQNSLLNTPPVFAIYMVGLVAKHLLNLGGLAQVEQLNKKKSELLYRCLDGSGGFYKPHAQADSRSHMNVNFNLASVELEAEFVSAAKKADMEGLKGHRISGGIRASIYNAVPLSSVQVLADFMTDFQRRKG